MKINFEKLIAHIVFYFLFLIVHSVNAQEKPNILLVVTDDMGFTDLGAFGGSDIRTSNLDRLAYEGMRFSNFHAAPSCAPTRAMLMTGTGNHEAGLGTQILYPEYVDAGVGYERYLTDRVVTIAERMSQLGYMTMFSGKWHLSRGSDSLDSLPGNRGFNSSYALHQGGDHHFGTVFEPGTSYSQNGSFVERPKGLYSTTLFTNKLIDFIDINAEDEQPFFAVYAPSAPHWPLQPPAEWKDRYLDEYSAGYDELCLDRMKGALREKVLDANTDISECPKEAPPWDALSDEEKGLQQRTMQLYAAMVEHLDTDFNRLLTHLEERELLQNTWVIYVNDNGPAGVSPKNGFAARLVGEIGLGDFDNSLENMGNPNSWVNIGQGWGDALSAPFRDNKGTQYEGGIRVAAFAWHANQVLRNSIRPEFLTVMDLAPTILSLAGQDPSALVYADGEEPIRGQSFSALFQGAKFERDSSDSPLILDSAGKPVIFYGDYKMIKPPANNWELYNLAIDPNEENDLSEKNSDLVNLLMSHYQRISAERNYIPRSD